MESEDFDIDLLSKNFFNLKPLLNKTLKMNLYPLNNKEEKKIKFKVNSKIFKKPYKFEITKTITAIPRILISKTTNIKYPEFSLDLKNIFSISNWKFIIYNNELKPIKEIKSNDKPESKILIKDIQLEEGTFYYYELIITDKYKNQLKSSRELFVILPAAVETEKEIIFNFPAINFDYASAVLKQHAYSILDTIAKKLKSTPGKIIRIEGHTDNTGDQKSNLRLSEQRALAVMNYFAGAKKINQDMFVTKGYGDEKPKASNQTEAGRQVNRRVEIIIEK